MPLERPKSVSYTVQALRERHEYVQLIHRTVFDRGNQEDVRGQIDAATSSRFLGLRSFSVFVPKLINMSFLDAAIANLDLIMFGSRTSSMLSFHWIGRGNRESCKDSERHTGEEHSRYTLLCLVSDPDITQGLPFPGHAAAQTPFVIKHQHPYPAQITHALVERDKA